MTKRRLDEADEERSPIKRMCNNPNLVRVRPGKLISVSLFAATKLYFLMVYADFAEIPVMARLRQASRRFWANPEPRERAHFQQVKCKVCEKLTPSDDDWYDSGPTRCNFCENFMCANCLVNCDRCNHSFCSFCAIRVYNSGKDSGICLSCI